MFERMLEKKKKPSFEEFISYCESTKELILNLDIFLAEYMGLDNSQYEKVYDDLLIINILVTEVDGFIILCLQMNI